MSSGPWRWVTWDWVGRWGKGVDYSLPHLVADDCPPTQLRTACGLDIGKIKHEQKLFEPPPRCCKRCLAAWRKR